MSRVLPLLAALAATLGLAQPAQAAAPVTKPLVPTHADARFDGQVSKTCEPAGGCVVTVTGVLRTRGPQADCYTAQAAERGVWTPFTGTRCGHDRDRYTRTWRIFVPGFYRICRGGWPDCGPEVRSPV